MKNYHLSIVTPEKTIYDEQIESLIAPGTLGYLGILANHAPLMTGLVPGKITIRKANGELDILAISGGFLEVSRNKATILADAIEWSNEIDISKARETVEQARRKLQSREGDLIQTQKELENALNLVKIYTDEHSPK